ncbi:MAG: gluconolactonase [Solirubrobacterales bacterium 70-9]|nr:MAG: gluconolactonase [Solirubrobacterales bacterium 70-9]
MQGERLAGDPYEVLDPEFLECIDPVGWVEKLHTGCRWAEGPVYFAEMRCLLFSDIPTQRLLRFDEQSGTVDVLRAPTGNGNGNTRDREGRLLSCEQGRNRVVRYEPDGRLTIIADSYEGGALNSPNDVVVKSDGSIWFTDPNFGIISEYVGNKARQEQESCGVYRVDPCDGSVRLMVDDFAMPNGLAFSPDERLLYVAESGWLIDPKLGHEIRAFEVGDDDSLGDGEVFAEVTPGIPDGFRIDCDGRLWVGAGDGVQCFAADGRLLGKILIPEATANLTFGGPKRNRLYITATTSLYATYLNVTGVQSP